MSKPGKRKQVSSPSQESGTESSREENKHVKKPRLGKGRAGQASFSISNSSSSAAKSSSAAAQLTEAQASLQSALAEIKEMKLKHAAEERRNEERISQLLSDNMALTLRNEELEREVGTLRRCF